MALYIEYKNTFVRTLLRVCELVRVRASTSASASVEKYLLSDTKSLSQFATSLKERQDRTGKQDTRRGQ